MAAPLAVSAVRVGPETPAPAIYESVDHLPPPVPLPRVQSLVAPREPSPAVALVSPTPRPRAVANIYSTDPVGHLTKERGELRAKLAVEVEPVAQSLPLESRGDVAKAASSKKGRASRLPKLVAPSWESEHLRAKRAAKLSSSSAK